MANDPWAATNQGLSNLGNTMMSLAQLKRDDEQQAKRNSLIDLQTQQAQQAVDQSKLTLADMGAKQGALIDQYGTAKHTAPLASAYSFQAQQEKETEQRKAAMEKGKYAFDEYLKVAKAVDEGILDENQATTFYNQAMKLVGNDLESAGVKLEFKKQRGGYYTGPVNPESLFMVNGQPTKYGAAGVVTAARVVGRDEQTGMPILEMDERTKFEQAKPDQMEIMDKRFAQQQQLQSEQIAAQDRRTAAQIAAADRRSDARADGSSKAPSGYRWGTDGTSLEAIPGGPGDMHGGGKGKVLPAGQLESIADMKRVKDVMAEARQALTDKKVETGPVAGRLQSLGSLVGLASDNFVDVQQKLQTAENIMLKLRSGAAVTESEYQRFKKEFPRTSDSPDVMKRKMNNAIAYANTLMDDKLSIYEEGGYRIPQSVRSNGAAATKAVPKAAKGKGNAGYADLLNKYRK